MNRVIIERLTRTEGHLGVFQETSEGLHQIFLQSGQSTHLPMRMRGRYPLEATQLSQTLSEPTSIAHSIASVSALEDYLQLYPTESALRIRQILLDLSAIKAHIYHFYWRILPDYLNRDFQSSSSPNSLWFYSDKILKHKSESDLPLKIGNQILANIPDAIRVIDYLQKTITLFSGKYPVIMNQIPGGLTNFSIKRTQVMQAVRHLDLCKKFIEEVWPADVKLFIRNVQETIKVIKKNVNLISFGSLDIEQNRGKTSNYSEGILLAGKLEPVNELKIADIYTNTYLVPFDKSQNGKDLITDPKKPNARTWIKGARYDGEAVLAGALSRMMVTHLAGANLEVSDKVGQMIDDLELTFEAPSCIASRLLSEVLESRIYLQNIFRNFYEMNDSKKLNQKKYFDFSEEGVGVGKVEAPSGSLLHQIFIADNRITNYRIVTPMNWNFSTLDESGQSGIVESELNLLAKNGELTPEKATRILHSYNALIPDGTQ